MKLSTFAIALTFTVASVQAFAQNVVLKPIDDNFETQVCFTAATQGYSEARKFVRSQGVKFNDLRATVSCNGQSISDFAKAYAKNTVTDEATDEATIITLIAKDTDIASKACVEAITIGEDKARAKYSLEGEVISCNFTDMSDFVRQYDTENVVVRDIAED